MTLARFQTSQKGTFTNGEHFLLGGRPASWGVGAEIPPSYFYKRRYTWDGDPGLIGCTIGCTFCYYRWIDNTADTIGTGTQGLRRNGEPEGAVKFLQNSKLFIPETDIVLLGTRSDSSMQVDFCSRFLQTFPYPDVPVFFLHRGYFGEKQLAWASDRRAVYCTTITANPEKTETVSGDWTPIRTDKQLDGIKFLLDNGIPSKRISIMLGPINSNNLDGSLAILSQIRDLGIEFLTYRGCSVGNFGVAPDETQLRDKGFLDGGQDETAAPAGHDYYSMKNWLAPEVEAKIKEAGANLGMRLYRFTGTLYENEFGRQVARNRNNQWRRQLGDWEEVNTWELFNFLDWLGYHPQSIDQNEEGYLVTLPEDEWATEDVAMSVGAKFKTSVIFNNHRISPTMEDLHFYAKNQLFDIGYLLNAL